MYTIYLVKNTINGKIYVGQTRNTVAARWKQHKSSRNCKNVSFMRAIAKYGPSSFEVSELDKTEDRNQSNWLESFYIGLLRANNRDFGYNETRGGEGGARCGWRHSEDAKERISAGNRGKIFSEETRAKMRTAWLTREVSAETRKKMSASRLGSKNPRYGKRWSPEERKKLGHAPSGWHHTEESKRKAVENKFLKTVAWG